MTLEETLRQIKPLNEEKMKTARRRWDSIAKPLHSLGKMEDLITQIVGITGEEKVDLGKKALVAMCADNGVVEEGVTQTGQEAVSYTHLTMVIEVAGVWFFAEIIHMNDMVGKFITQFVVLALNYIFSKFLVFTSGRKS